MGDIYSDLKEDEGWVPHVYRDSLGYWTIGFGFMVDSRRGGRLPLPVAEYWLRWEVTQNRKQLRAREPRYDPLPSGVRRAVDNMAYQLGVNGVLGFRRMWDALGRRAWEEAADHALDSVWATQTPKRAGRVADRIRRGE